MAKAKIEIRSVFEIHDIHRCKQWSSQEKPSDFRLWTLREIAPSGFSLRSLPALLKSPHQGRRWRQGRDLEPPTFPKFCSEWVWAGTPSCHFQVPGKIHHWEYITEGSQVLSNPHLQTPLQGCPLCPLLRLFSVQGPRQCPRPPENPASCVIHISLLWARELSRPPLL